MKSNLTVVVPIYNVEKYLPKCIDSILYQSISVDEIILVDDGSTDKSGEIADMYAMINQRIEVIHQNNRRLSAARNLGIAASTKEYIAFVDSDDYIEKNMYEKLMERLIEFDADISISGVWYEQENGEKYSPYEESINKVLNKEEALIELNSFRYFNMSFCDAIFKRKLFETNGYGEGKLRFPDGKLCEDFYLMHKIIARAERIVYTSTPLYHYIQRDNSISRNSKVNLAPMEASEEQLKFYSKWFPKLTYIAETARFFAYLSIYNTYCRNTQDCPQKLVNKIDNICRKDLISVLTNKYISNKKKVQAVVFCTSKFIYKAIIRRVMK